jgi:hypothetical protein
VRGNKEGVSSFGGDEGLEERGVVGGVAIIGAAVDLEGGTREEAR